MSNTDNFEDNVIIELLKKPNAELVTLIIGFIHSKTKLDKVDYFKSLSDARGEPSPMSFDDVLDMIINIQPIKGDNNA